MELLLIRHGESVANAEGRVAGHSDYPLSELGVEQAKRVASWLSATGIAWDAAYSSPLSRALSTARIICDKTGRNGPELDPDLSEISAGELEGLTRDEVEARYPSFVDRKVTDPVVRHESCVEKFWSPGNRVSPPFRMSGLLVNRWM